MNADAVSTREPVASARDWKPRIAAGPTAAIYGVLLVACVVGAIASPDFLSSSNLVNLLFAISFLGVVAVGMTYVTLSGGFVDLSVGAVVAASAITCVLLLPHGLIVGLVAGIGVGLASGLVNGALIGWLRANPVIVTFGSASLVTGVTLTASRGQQAYARNELFTDAGDLRLLGVPISVLVLFALVAIAHAHITRSVWGRRLLGTGMNFEVMRLAGLRPGRVQAGAFVIAGVLAGVAGLMLSASTETASASLGADFPFDAITAVVLGGTLLTGGRGSVVGTLGGVLLVGTLNNLMVLNGVGYAYQQVVKGVVLVAALGAQVALARRVSVRA